MSATIRCMTTERLVVNSDERVDCPRRGEIDVEWCFGCPRRVNVQRRRNKTTIVCEPGTGYWYSHDPGPLRDVPDI